MRGRVTAGILATVLAALLGGCGGVVSRSPASDGSTTRTDERLIGFWRVDFLASQAGANATRDEAVVVVGHRSATDAGLRVVTVHLKAGQDLETTAGDVAATTIAGKAYASLDVRDERDPAAEPTFAVLRYDLPDADTMRVFGMDETKVAADVRSGAIHGTASDPKEGSALTVTIDVSTAALRAYLESKGDGVYRAERPLVLRRLRLR